jgi:very-short-patch-repair endonuclease
MTPNNHTNKNHPQGCPQCYGTHKSNDEEFKKKAELIHNGKYIYNNSKYIDAHTDLYVTCPIHGDFKVTPNNHLLGRGCPECKREKSKNLHLMSKEEFFRKCKEKYGNNFIYDENSFTSLNENFNYICKKHGKMTETGNFHLHTKCGCRKCAEEKINTPKKNIETFKKELYEKYGDLYTFKTEDYKGMRKKMTFNCKIHGNFTESPTNLMRGCKCKKCGKKYSLEEEINKFLNKKNIFFELHKNTTWLGKLSLDFYLPKYNVAIECQGRQHYEEVKQFGGEESFKTQQERDQRKKKLCEENGIKLLYYTNYKDVEEDNEITFKDKEKLLKYINENNFTR